MNTSNFGYWNEKKEKFKRIYQNISEDDLHFREGKEKEMIEMLAFKLGKTKDELRSIINSLD